MATRLAICDDAPGFRLLLEKVFTEAGFEVVGTATSWAEAEALVEHASPEAVLLDLWLPTLDREALTRVAAAAEDAVVAVVTSLSVDEAADIVAGIQGVDLVLSKRDPPAELAGAVRARCA